MKKNILNRKGVTLIESLVGVVLILGSIMGALGVLQLVSGGQKKNEDDLDYVAKRNQVISLLIDDTSWGKMVDEDENPEMGCLLKQDATSESERDCTGKTDSLRLLNIKGELVYDFRSAVVGFSRAGKDCDTYDGTPGGGNPVCPYRLDVRWEALCSSSPCINPPIRFRGTHSFNSPLNQIVPNLEVLDFTVIKMGMFCPSTTVPNGLVAGSQTTYVAPSQVMSDQNTKVNTIGIARSNQVMVPCRRINMSFVEDMPNAGDVSAPYYAIDPENNASVAIVNEGTNTAVYEFVRHNIGGVNTYELRYNGVTVFNKPNWLTIDRSTLFQFKIVNGLVKFCIEERCYHYFPEKLDFPFRFSFRPAALPYSPTGISGVSTSMTDL
ncbi:MAG: hypothetical protein AAGB31_01110 [Bdellovibrio sp.]